MLTSPSARPIISVLFLASRAHLTRTPRAQKTGSGLPMPWRAQARELINQATVAALDRPLRVQVEHRLELVLQHQGGHRFGGPR